jgi:hypothetical protein
MVGAEDVLGGLHFHSEAWTSRTISLQLLRILTPDLDDVKSYKWLVPTGQLKCAQVLEPRNVHTPWPMVITTAACTCPMSRKTEINRHSWARSFSKMHAICVRRSSTSIRSSATPGSLQAGTGRPRKIVLRSLTRSGSYSTESYCRVSAESRAGE